MSFDVNEFLKAAGAGGMVFLCFYLLLKTSNAQMMAIIKGLTEQQNQMFQILSSMIEQGNLQLSYLQEIKTLVSGNLWCPYVRETAGMKQPQNNKGGNQ